MAGKTRPSLLKKTLKNVETSALSNTDKECIKQVFEEFSRVVRCKDCRMFCENKEAFVSYCKRGLHNIDANPDDFCSYGERKE